MKEKKPYGKFASMVWLLLEEKELLRHAKACQMMLSVKICWH